MRREILEVQHLLAESRERLQHARLGAAGGAAQHAQVERRAHLFEHLHHMAAIGLVAAGQLLRVPADLAHHGDHGAAAHAAAPAVDEGRPAFGHLRKLLLDVTRDIGRHQRAADAPGLEGAVLHVERADAGTLLVVEHGRVDGAGDAVVRVFGRRAHVDQGIEALDRIRADGCSVAHRMLW